MKRGIVLAVVGTVSAHVSKTRWIHVPTTITHDGDVPLSGGRALITGRVKVRRERDVCQLFRVVDVTARLTDGTTKVLDNGVAGAHGAWAVEANLAGVDRVKAKVRRLRFARTFVTRPHHRRRVQKWIVCAPAVVTWRVD
jgi:hypothetical protein